MEVIFRAHIKKAANQLGYEIVLSDSISGESIVCSDVRDFSTKIEQMGLAYKGTIDQVIWSKDDDLHPLILDNIRLEMMHEEQEIKGES